MKIYKNLIFIDCTSHIYLEGVLSTTSAETLIFRLPGLINSITIGGGVEVLQLLGVFFIEFPSKLRRLVRAWSFTFFFQCF